MTVLESAVLGILAVLLTGYVAGKSIQDDLMRMICCAGIVAAFWILAVIIGKEVIALVVADIFA
jgi:VIT1/CCC1 family predicted Fe2+/Mn2+ transporter